jgi:hypothetical protein
MIESSENLLIRLLTGFPIFINSHKFMVVPPEVTKQGLGQRLSRIILKFI